MFANKKTNERVGEREGSQTIADGDPMAFRKNLEAIVEGEVALSWGSAEFAAIWQRI